MPEQLTRRRFLAVGGALAATVLVAACGQPAAPTPTAAPVPTRAPEQPPTPTTAPAKAEAPKPTEPPKPTAAPSPTLAPQPKPAAQIKLNFWGAHGGAKECQAYKDMAAAYTKLNPNVTFDKVQCGAGQQNFNEVLLARIAAGDPPDITIIWSTPVSLGVRGSLVPVDDLMKGSKYSAKENWPSAVLASCEWGGKVYGFPTMSAAYGMFYNQEWFEKQGVPSDPKSFPKTWDELRKLSKQFTKWSGDKLTTAGYIPFERNWDPELFPIWVGTNGGKIFEPDSRKYTIDAEPNVAILEYFLSWLDEEYKGDITKVKKSGAWGLSPGKEGQPPGFQTQKVATLMDGSWWMNFMYSEVPPTFEKWNVAPIPYGPGGSKSVAGFWPNWWAIPKGTKVREDAFNYVDWINGDGIRTWFAIIADLPACRKFPRDLLPDVAVQKRGKDFTKQTLDFFYNQFETSVPMWTSPVEDFSVDQIGRALEKIARKAAKPKEALAEAQKASQAELEKVLKASQ